MQIQSVVFHRGAYKPEDFPRDQRPQFAIVGRSNVGKSSLINTILGKKGIARVSQTPGKTQAIHFYLVNERFHIVDLPGYGYAKVSREISHSWGDLVRSYLESAGELRMIFLLIDCRRDPTGEDLMLRDWLVESGREWKAILTKSDKLSNNGMATSRKRIAATLETDPSDLIRFSKVTRAGVEELWREVDQRM